MALRSLAETTNCSATNDEAKRPLVARKMDSGSATHGMAFGGRSLERSMLPC